MGVRLGRRGCAMSGGGGRHDEISAVDVVAGREHAFHARERTPFVFQNDVALFVQRQLTDNRIEGTATQLRGNLLHVDGAGRFRRLRPHLHGRVGVQGVAFRIVVVGKEAIDNGLRRRVLVGVGSGRVAKQLCPSWPRSRFIGLGVHRFAPRPRPELMRVPGTRIIWLSGTACDGGELMRVFPKALEVTQDLEIRSWN